MSIKVRGLTKQFGEQKAVNNVSFEIHQGEIVGFLGPNGAGKTTTMKMLTGILEPSEGDAEILGLDFRTQKAEIKKRVGYLAEANPLYTDMYIEEFLYFIANVHKIENRKAAVDSAIERTGLIPERNKKINQLSKGFRQRIGLAQAIIHDPEVLILDEPVSGLDPNQLRDIRGLIKNLSANKTIIFSSHILQEVQALCNRVLIINNGILVADDNIEDITRTATEQYKMRIQTKEAINLKDLKASLVGVNASDQKALSYHLSWNGDIEKREEIFKYLVAQNHMIYEMKMEQNSVEDVFQKLTQ